VRCGFAQTERALSRLLPTCLLIAACGLPTCTPKVRMPPGLPPTPKTVTREEPGGDAHDPHEHALLRLSREPWGSRNDKREVFQFPLTDPGNWRRVRFWGVPTFVGFRYGDVHHAIAGMRVVRVRPPDPPTPKGCLDRFLEWGGPIADGYSARLKDEADSQVTWKAPNDVLVRTWEAEVVTLLARKRYFGVMGAFLPWEGVCAVYGYAFHIDDKNDLVRKVRDRYAREAFGRMVRMPDKPPDGIE
jgi:hypothetical protein